MENKSDCWPCYPLHPFYFNPQIFMNMMYQYPHPLSYPQQSPQLLQEKQIKKEEKTMQTNQTKVLKTKKTRKRKVKVDPDFDCLEFKKKHNTALQQKEGRNTASNILRTFTKFFVAGKIDTLFEKAKRIHGIEISKDQLLLWMGKVGLNYRNYIKVNWVAKNLDFSSKQAKIFFILLKNHLNVQAKIHILTSAKIKQKNKLLTLKKINNLMEELCQHFQSYEEESSQS